MSRSRKVWQIISSAPRDGFEILVCDMNSPIGPCYVVYWLVGESKPNGGWCVMSDGEKILWVEPTHWTNIPKLPERT